MWDWHVILVSVVGRGRARRARPTGAGRVTSPNLSRSRGGGEVIGKILVWSLVGTLTIAAGTWFWVEKAGAQLQQTVLTTGWSVVSVITLLLTGFAFIKLLKPTRGYRP